MVLVVVIGLEESDVVEVVDEPGSEVVTLVDVVTALGSTDKVVVVAVVVVVTAAFGSTDEVVVAATALGSIDEVVTEGMLDELPSDGP